MNRALPIICTILIASCSALCVQSAELVERLRQADSNGDGKLSREEAKAIPLLSRMFDTADGDGDGLLSAEEIRSALRSRFGGDPVANRPLSPPPTGVEQNVHTLTVDGRERRFIVQAPKKPRDKLPVLFVFHGGGGRAENMLLTANFGPLVARENFIAVYPSAWQNHWNDGRKAAGLAAQKEGVDDVKFVRAIVDELAKQYPLDRSRIFATGGSNGGIFCHYLAAKAADVFAAIAPIIGGLAEPVAADFKPSRPISLLVIQGDADPLVPIDGGPIAGGGRRGKIISTEQMLTLYLQHNRISGQPTEELLPDLDPDDGCRAVVRRYPPGVGGVIVEYWLIRGGGHTLPGKGGGRLQLAEGFIGNTCRDFDFREVVWSFFKSCPPR